MIRYKKVTPIRVIDSRRDFEAPRAKTINEMRQVVERCISQMQITIGLSEKYRGSIVYAYTIQKFRTKKRNTEKWKSSSVLEGGKVVVRETTRKGYVIAHIYEFRRENVAYFRQFPRTFIVDIKL